MTKRNKTLATVLCSAAIAASRTSRRRRSWTGKHSFGTYPPTLVAEKRKTGCEDGRLLVAWLVSRQTTSWVASVVGTECIGATWGRSVALYPRRRGRRSAVAPRRREPRGTFRPTRRPALRPREIPEPVLRLAFSAARNRVQKIHAVSARRRRLAGRRRVCELYWNLCFPSASLALRSSSWESH